MNIPTISILGAEKQSATSIALAYPQRKFLFVTDSPVVDGWDLDNVRFKYSTPDTFSTVQDLQGAVLVACPRWAKAGGVSIRNKLGSFSLTRIFRQLETDFPNSVLPITANPEGNGPWIVKGDLWHRPDFTVSGTAAEVTQTADPYGCSSAFQSMIDAKQTMLAVGTRFANGRTAIGVIGVHHEAQCREAMLLAGETVAEPDVIDLSMAMIASLDHYGPFSFNWLRTSGSLLLSSFRPVPRAVFQTFQRAGIDMLQEPPQTVAVARPGVKFIARQHYSHYESLR